MSMKIGHGVEMQAPAPAPREEKKKKESMPSASSSRPWTQIIHVAKKQDKVHARAGGRDGRRCCMLNVDK
jgi:hypothetical protein